MQTTFEFSILFLELFLWILRTTLWKTVGEVIVYILQMRNLILIHTCQNHTATGRASSGIQVS